MSNKAFATMESHKLREAIDKWEELSKGYGSSRELFDAIEEIRDRANACLGEYDG